jgi:hypothetical protein
MVRVAHDAFSLLTFGPFNQSDQVFRNRMLKWRCLALVYPSGLTDV